jgi:acyl carrier protein
MEVDVLDLVINEIASTMDVPADSLSAETSLADLGMDSLEVLQLLVALEEATKMQFKDSDLKQFVTVQSIVDLLNERWRKAAA